MVETPCYVKSVVAPAKAGCSRFDLLRKRGEAGLQVAMIFKFYLTYVPIVV